MSSHWSETGPAATQDPMLLMPLFIARLRSGVGKHHMTGRGGGELGHSCLRSTANLSAIAGSSFPSMASYDPP
jgi:hypothetical protein